MNQPPIPTLGTPRAPHRYAITVDPVVQDVVTGVIDGKPHVVEHVRVHVIHVLARTRWAAMDIARQAAYVVKGCELLK